MRPMMRALTGLLLAAVASGAARAEPPLRIGVLTDMSGNTASASGNGSVTAARMAVEDFRAQSGPLPFTIDIVSADHQNNPEIASTIARRWLSDGVNAIVDVPNSAVVLAVNALVRNSDAALLVSTAGNDALTAKECSPNTVHWTFNMFSLANNTAEQVVASGGDTWYFITADYAGGHNLESVAAAFVTAAGGRVLGHTFPPQRTTDYSSFIVQAQASHAKVVAFAMGGDDLTNALKAAGEFGLTEGGQTPVALVMFLDDIHALGLASAKGLTFTTAFYWDMDDAKRAFARRFASQNGGFYPSDAQAGVYASVLDYLKAVVSGGSRSGPAVVARMKSMPTDDPLFGQGMIRSDGRMIHDMYIVQVKAPGESHGPWDYLKVLKTIPGNQAFAPSSAKECSLVK